MLSALLIASVLLGSGWCGPSPTTPGVTASPELEPQPAATEDVAAEGQALDIAPTAAEDAVTVGRAPSFAGGVTMDQVITELTGFFESTIRSTTAASLAEMAKTLTSIQEGLTTVSDRLDSAQSLQNELQRTQNRLSSRFDAMQQSFHDVSSRLDTMQERQDAALSSHSEIIQKTQGDVTTLSGVVSALLGELSALSGRFDTNEASLSNLSSRVDALLQSQSATASGPAVVCDGIHTIQAAVSRIPWRVLGEPCKSDAECSDFVPGAICDSDRLCSCSEGYRRLSATRCRQHSRLGGPCKENADCQTLTSNAVCTSGVCGCETGFWNNNNTECRPAARVSQGGACVDNQDCSTGLSCVSGTCSCKVARYGQYEYKLAGSSSCSYGRVELKRSRSSWGLVCDDDWDDADAKVLCRSLGFRSGSGNRESRYGRGTNFYMDNVHCSGSESHLLDCDYVGWGQHNCGAGEVAGVSCNA